MVLTAQEILDITNAYDVKIFLLCIITIYCISAIYWSFKIEGDKISKQIFKYLVLRIPPCIYLFFLPLYSIFLFNSVSVEVILIPLFFAYTIVSTIFLLSWISLGTEFVLKLFGVEWKTKREFDLNKNND